MEGTRVAPLLATEPTDLSELIRQLRCEVRELRQEVADLRRENSELRQQVGYWKAMHARAVHRAEQLEAEVEQLRGENRKLQDQLFGQKSEAAPSQDRTNHLEGEVEEDQAPSTPRKRGQRKDRPGPKRRDYSHLPAVEDLRVLPEEERVCPQCRAALSPSDTEDSEQIEIEVKAYRRVIRRRRYQRTCSCANGPRTITAPPAPKLIPKGLFGVSVWVEILLDKYSSHRPTERLLAQWQLLGLDVAAGTVADGLKRLEPLFQPLYEALLSRNAASAFAQADETRWMVFIDLDGKAGHRWWLWVFLGEDTVVFRLDPTRGHDVPEAVIRRRWSAGLRALFDVYLPLVDRWQIFDNSDLPVREVARGGPAGLVTQTLDEGRWRRLLMLAVQSGATASWSGGELFDPVAPVDDDGQSQP